MTTSEALSLSWFMKTPRSRDLSNKVLSQDILCKNPKCHFLKFLTLPSQLPVLNEIQRYYWRATYWTANYKTSKLKP